jgi:hypothetical protein
MTYFDMVNQVQTMRQSAEELAIRKCVMALNGAPSPAPA